MLCKAAESCATGFSSAQLVDKRRAWSGSSGKRRLFSFFFPSPSSYTWSHTRRERCARCGPIFVVEHLLAVLERRRARAAASTACGDVSRRAGPLVGDALVDGGTITCWIVFSAGSLVWSDTPRAESCPCGTSTISTVSCLDRLPRPYPESALTSGPSTTRHTTDAGSPSGHPLSPRSTTTRTPCRAWLPLPLVPRVCAPPGARPVISMAARKTAATRRSGRCTARRTYSPPTYRRRRPQHHALITST